MIRVLLADDHALVVEAMRLLLERIEGVKVVAEAHDGLEAVARARELRPDIAILDISMRELNGIEAARQIHDAVPETRILILSSHTDEEHVQRAVRAGVAGYLVKDSLPGELAAAVLAVARGGNYLSPGISGHVMAGVGRPISGDAATLESLSARQREVLRMLAEGKSTKEIAFALEVSVKTVETHRAAISERLGIRDVAGLVLFAVRSGLIDVDRR